MIDSELGKIPKGWEVRRLADLIYLERGLSHKGKFLSNTGIPLINLRCISSKDGFIKEGIQYYNGDFVRRHTAIPGDILIANTDISQKREILGSPVIVPDDTNLTYPIIFTHHFYAVRFFDSLKPVDKEFVYGIMKTIGYEKFVKTYATGITELAISKESVLNYKFVYPTKILIELFSNLSQIIIDKIKNNKNINSSLLAIHDSLPLKLMLGKIRVLMEDGRERQNK